ncbi:MAG: hypothetical protein NVSMB18_34010 [Acetobacteraceae bacterium]
MRTVRRTACWVVIGLALGGCAETRVAVVDAASLSPGALGSNGDPDVTAINQAQWAFADAARTYGRPIEAARAAAAMEYVAGAFNTSPRWDNVSPLTKQQLLQGREEVRQALGVVPGTPSQVVVDRLASAGNALSSGNQQAATAVLGPPAFNASGDQVLARLSNLPYMRMANVSTMRAANQLFDNTIDERF